MTKKPNRAEHRPDGSTVIYLESRDGTIQECLIDTADYPAVKGYRWRASKRKHTYYVTAKRNSVLLHRFLFPDSETVDHRDHNGLHNRRANLRPATFGQNVANREKPVCGVTSKYKGVHWDKSRSKFQAKIGVNHKHYMLGRFPSEIEAARAYNEAATKYFGEFASLNQIPEAFAA